MRLEGDRYVCTACGAELHVADTSNVRIGHVSSSAKPRERVVYVDGVVVHRCVPEQAPSSNH